MWLTPKLVSECTLNSNISANHGENKNDQDNENLPDNKNEDNYPANKYRQLKSKIEKIEKKIEKKFWWLYG